MKLSTMAAVMSFVTKIEGTSAAFYETFGAKIQEGKGGAGEKAKFSDWAKENRKFEKMVKQTYFGVITDAIESNFSFGDMDTNDYEIETELALDAGFEEVVKMAGEIESRIKDFYLKGAEVSEGLMADISRVFKKLAKKREERLLDLVG